MEVIKRWLSGSKNFIVGKTYYKQFSGDKQLIQLFDKGETPFAKNELIKALTALLSEPAPPPVKKNTPEVLAIMPAGLDAISISIEKDWKENYQRMNYLRHELDKFGTSNDDEAREQRRLIAKEILELEQKCMKAWETLDYYLINKKLPEEKQKEIILPSDPVELARKIQTLEKNIRRNKQKAKLNQTDVSYPAKIKYYEDQLNHIKSKS